MPARLRTIDRKRALVLLGLATVALDVVLVVIDRRLTATGGPSILGFEFVGSRRRAAEILAEWGDHGQDLARLSLWIDFAFMASYGAFFALASVATRDFAKERGLRLLAAVGAVTPAFAVCAALFDACENIALLLILGGHGGSLAPPVATGCASLKFLLITTAIVYVLWGLAARVLLRRDRVRADRV
jgi:hypothetical protein